MEDIKLIFRNASILACAILIYGLILQNKYILLGSFGGAVLSIGGFYSLCQDVKTQVYQQDASRARAFARYLKRYVAYGLFLGILGKVYGLEMILSGAIGLLNIKLNIYLLPLIKKIRRYNRKEE